MSTQTGGNTSIKTVDTESFLTKPADLSSLHNELKRHGKAAIAALVGLLASKEEKIRMNAAEKLLQLDMDVVKAMNTEQMQRLIAEIKLNRNGTKRLTDVDTDSRPLVDFENIQEIE